MIEFIGFNAITIIMGRISGIYAAAQNIVCTMTSVSFMVPLAISNATAVKVGFANGAKYYKSLKTYAYTGIALCVAFMTCSAIVVGTFPVSLLKLFTRDPELIKVSIPVVYVLCFFQIFDGLQVALAGIFKGIKQEIEICLYHSLHISSMPEKCKILAHNSENIIMAIKHKKYPIYGLQFHPEAVLTQKGKKILKNFMKL